MVERKEYKLQFKTGSQAVIELSKRQFDVYQEKDLLKRYNILEQPKELSKEALEIDEVSKEKVKDKVEGLEIKTEEVKEDIKPEIKAPEKSPKQRKKQDK